MVFYDSPSLLSLAHCLPPQLYPACTSASDGEFSLLCSHKAARFQKLIEQQRLRKNAIISGKLS